MDESILNVTSKPEFSDLFNSYKIIEHYPLASTTYRFNDDIRFQVENQDNFWLPSVSYITIEGNIARNPAASPVQFINRNALMHLFTECKYMLNGVEVDRTRGLGVATTLKSVCSLTTDEVFCLQNAGWDVFSQVVQENDRRNFRVCIPLKLILGFAEDYKKILLTTRQELIFTRNRSDIDALINQAAADALVVPLGGDLEATTVNIEKMTWCIPSIGLSDRARISILNIINKDLPIQVPFRTWEYHEHPSVPTTTGFTWTITSTSQLEKPRYILVGFQTNRKNSYLQDPGKFDHINVTNLRVFLNTEVFPYTNMNLNFTQNKFGPAYQSYIEFQRVYYNQTLPSPIIQYKDFGNGSTIFVIDCSKQNERIKFGGTDIRLEVQTTQANAIPANTSCHCLILHDRIVEYTPLSNIVRKL